MSNLAKETLNIQVTNWLLVHKEEIKDDVDILKGMTNERRKNSPIFVGLEQRIFNDFARGTDRQRTMFLYATRGDFKEIVGDRIMGFDEVMEMAYNFSLFPNPFATC